MQSAGAAHGRAQAPHACLQPHRHVRAGRSLNNRRHVGTLTLPARQAAGKVLVRAATAAAGAAADEAGLLQHLLSTPLPDLMQQAADLRDEAHPRIITFSPKASPHVVCIARLGERLQLLQVEQGWCVQ
jgi:hypothetical protein